MICIHSKNRKIVLRSKKLIGLHFRMRYKKTKKNSDFDLRNNKETKCESVLPNQNSRPSSLLRNWKLHTSWIRRKFQERNFFSSLTSRTSTPSLYLKLDDDGKLWIVGGCWIMRAPNSVWSEEKNSVCENWSNWKKIWQSVGNMGSIFWTKYH